MATTLTSVTNHFPSPQDGFTTSLSGTIGSGATTVGLNSVAGYTNGQIAVFVVDPTDVTKKQTFTGTIDTAGIQVTGVIWTAGTNVGHTAGATVVDYASATHIGMISKGLLVSNDQDGTLKAGAVDNAAVLASNVVTTAKIINDAVTTAKVVDNAITAAKIANLSEFVSNFVASGGIWSGDAYASTRLASMTAIVCYIGGLRVTASAVTGRTFTASRDTYVDILSTAGVGSVVYTEATNNAASPALAASSIRIGIVVTGATTIAAATSVNQGKLTALLPTSSSAVLNVSDTLGNTIYNTNTGSGIIAYRSLASAVAAGSTGITNALPTTFIVPAGRQIKYTVHGKSGNFNTSQNSIFDVTANLDAGTTLNVGFGWLNGALAQSNTVGAYSIGYCSPSAGSHTIGINVNMAGFQMASLDARIMIELV